MMEIFQLVNSFFIFEEDESIPMLGFASVFTLDFKHRAFPYDEEKRKKKSKHINI